jgi:transcription elongation factor Elf1
MATMTKRERERITGASPQGFTLQCPVCGEAAVSITLDLSNLTICHCGSCDDEFSVATAVNMLADRLAQWQAVARWIDMAGEVLAPPTSTESE